MLTIALLSACSDHDPQMARTWTDVFQQSTSNELDVLWVVSDAASMGEAQAALGAGAQAFLDEAVAVGLDLHLGVISTGFEYDDPERGVLIGDPPWLGSDADPAELARRFLVGTVAERPLDPAPSLEETGERGLDVALWALDARMTMEGGHNEGFRRFDAALSVIIVSTRDNTDADVGEPGVPPEHYVEAFRKLAATPALVTVQAVVGTSAPELGCAEEPGDDYLRVAYFLGGAMADVCDLPEDPSLAFPGPVAAAAVHTEFALSSAAVPSSIEVTVDDEPVEEDPASGWTYDPGAGPTGTLTFHGDAVPARGTAITVTYTER